MDILAGLKQEEAKWEKGVSAAQRQLDNDRAAMKLLGVMGGSGKATDSSTGTRTGGKKRVMSAAARAKISKATKERWAKYRAAQGKGKQKNRHFEAQFPPVSEDPYIQTARR